MYYELVFYLLSKVKSHFSSSKTSCASYDKFKSPGTFCIFICTVEYPKYFLREFSLYYKIYVFLSRSFTALALSSLFLISGQIHNYDTRTPAHFRPHSCRTNIKQFTILFQGPAIWNALPLSIRSSPSLSTFKRNLLGFLS